MKTLKLLLLFITLNLLMASCEKTDQKIGPVIPVIGDAPARLYSVRLTDAPGVYGAVWIDLKGVEVTCSDGRKILLNTNVGRYNLRVLTNGKDTLIAAGKVYGTVTKIRLILGPINWVVSSCIHYSLNMLSEDEGGLTVPISRMEGNKSSALLDFDANQSVIEMGNNVFNLKPVIRNVESSNSGSIKGKITPYDGIFAAITATSMFGSYSTFVDDPSEFLLKGVPPGRYTLHIVPNSLQSPKDITNVMVYNGSTSDIGTVTF